MTYIPVTLPQVGWITGLDVDFTAQTTVNPVTDGTYVFTGSPGGTFQAVNSLNHDGGNQSFLINGVGWQYKPTNTGFGQNGEYVNHTLALLRVSLPSIYSNITATTPLRIWLYVSGETQFPQQNGGTGEGQFIAIDDWNGSNYTWSIFANRGAGASAFGYYVAVDAPNGGFGQQGLTVVSPAPAVVMLYLPFGIGGRQAILYRYPLVSLSGTFNVTNGSVSVPTTSSQVGILAPGSQIIFGAQNTTYYVVAGVTSTGISLTGAYTGTTTAASTGFTNNTVNSLTGTFSVTNNNASVTATVSQTGLINPGDLLIFNSHSIGLSGTFNVANGSPSVTATSSQTGTLGPGMQITFASQSGTYYTISSVSGTAITLTGNYTGTSNAATSGSYLLPQGQSPFNEYQFTVQSVSGTAITLSSITPYSGTTISGVTAASVSKAGAWPSLATMVPMVMADPGISGGSNGVFNGAMYTSYEPMSNQYILIGGGGVPGTGGFNGYVATIARMRVDYLSGQ